MVTLTLFAALVVLPLQQTAPDVTIVQPVHHHVVHHAKPRPKAVAKDLAPNDVVDDRIHYADGFADYILRFQNDGQVLMTTVHKGGTDANEKTGKYRYKKLSGTTAILSIDETDYSLTFDLPNRARVLLASDPRPLWFYLEVPPKE